MVFHVPLRLHGVERTPNKSQHTKLTLEKKIPPPFLPGIKLETFRSWGRCSFNKLSRLDLTGTTTSTFFFFLTKSGMTLQFPIWFSSTFASLFHCHCCPPLLQRTVSKMSNRCFAVVGVFYFLFFLGPASNLSSLFFCMLRVLSKTQRLLISMLLEMTPPPLRRLLFFTSCLSRGPINWFFPLDSWTP